VTLPLLQLMPLAGAPLLLERASQGQPGDAAGPVHRHVIPSEMGDRGCAPATDWTGSRG